MEYVDGETLSERVRGSGPLGLRRGRHAAGQTADALVEAHGNGIVHRDVKPSNIMIAGGAAKLNDFGIARSEDDASLTQTGLVTGSPAYLAPEVASGSSATPASDVWSLGATLYHAVTGTAALRGGRQPDRRALQDRPRGPAAAARGPPDGRAAVGDDEPRPRAALADAAGARRAACASRAASASTVPVAPVVPAPPEQTGVLPPVQPPPAPTPAHGHHAPLGVDRGRGRAGGRGGRGGVRAGRARHARGAARRHPRQRRPGSQSSEPTPSASPVSAEDTREQMDAFITDYIATVTSDPRAAFERLTPEFQEASGGFEGYMGWWGTVRSAQIADVQQQPLRT